MYSGTLGPGGTQTTIVPDTTLPAEDNTTPITPDTNADNAGNITRQHQQEMLEMLQDIREVRVDNILHAPKLQRMGQLHAACAKSLQDQIKAEATSIKNKKQSGPAKGLKHLSKTIGDPPAKPLIFVKRDKDTADGENKVR